MLEEVADNLPFFKERAAEIIADDGRTLCSECHLKEFGRGAPGGEESDPNE
jgi:hypothetical protein